MAPVGGYHGLQHAGNTNNGFATIGWWNAQRVNELATKPTPSRKARAPSSTTPSST